MYHDEDVIVSIIFRYICKCTLFISLLQMQICKTCINREGICLANSRGGKWQYVFAHFCSKS